MDDDFLDHGFVRKNLVGSSEISLNKILIINTQNWEIKFCS